jgi:hypothetical protein
MYYACVIHSETGTATTTLAGILVPSLKRLPNNFYDEVTSWPRKARCDIYTVPKCSQAGVHPTVSTGQDRGIAPMNRQKLDRPESSDDVYLVTGCRRT